MRQPDLANGELAGKHSALLHADGPRRDVAFQRTLAVNCHRLSDNLPRHPAFDFDLLRAHRPKTVDVSFAIDHYQPGTDPAWDFPGVINGRGIAMQIAAQPAFDQSGLAFHATAGEIALAGKMHVTAGANASTESTGDFVIAQVDMCAARGTDG